MTTTKPWHQTQSEAAFLRSVDRNPLAHYSLHIEAVRVQDSSQMTGGYAAMNALAAAGTVAVSNNGLVMKL